MRKKLNLLPSLAGIGLLVVASGALAADAPSAPASGEAKLGGLPQLLGALKDIQIPSLTGLIQPEKMGVLTDNACRIADNEAQLLSDNEAQLMSENTAQLMSDNKADRDFQSGNSLDVLSNIRLLSDITVTVQVTVQQGEAKAAKPKKSDQARRQNKAKQEKARAEKAKAEKAKAEKAKANKAKADTAARAKKKP
jgi:hypothetical protein